MAKAEKTSNNWLLRLFQGRGITTDWYRKNIVAIVFTVGLILIFITFKYNAQLKQAEILKLRKELVDAKTNMVKVSAEYSSQIRESEMTQLADTMHLHLKVPEQPPYDLDRQATE